MREKARNLPRLVLVTRRTPYELLLERHGTPGQVEFYLRSRGQDITVPVKAQERFEKSLAAVQEAIPADQRRVRVDRDQLDRFLFAPDDIILVIGQDGLVPNTAKYLQGQLVVGVNSDPGLYDGVLCRHSPRSIRALLAWLRGSRGPAYRIEERVLARAGREDGQSLLALNEVFLGHRGHQSALYRLRAKGREERQSSSGLICSTGTGGTGWARSIINQRRLSVRLPHPEEPRLLWLVREPFPSVSTGTALDFGLLGEEDVLEITSEMGEGGLLFGDGIESDWVEFLEGQTVRITLADHRLRLVVPV